MLNASQHIVLSSTLLKSDPLFRDVKRLINIPLNAARKDAAVRLDDRADQLHCDWLKRLLKSL